MPPPPGDWLANHHFVLQLVVDGGFEVEYNIHTQKSLGSENDSDLFIQLGALNDFSLSAEVERLHELHNIARRYRKYDSFGHN